MNIQDYRQFGEDLFSSLKMTGGKFEEILWNEFLQKYFSFEHARNIQVQVLEDLEFFKTQDPASQEYTPSDILSVRRGMIAIAAHRVFSQILSENSATKTLFEVEVLAKSIQMSTNIEIHPQATIGKNFAIDHGHGTVIGATTIMGENVFIYHGVTLGATGRKSKSGRRHPKLGNNIFLGNGTQILGPSILGNNVSISSEAMVLDSILGNDVTVSPGVLVSKVEVPNGYKIFRFDPQIQKFIGRKPDSDKKVETFELERIKF